MIVREHPNHFIMIEQDNHAQLSGEMIANWNDSLFIDTKFKKTVEFAIFHHDCGWKSFDKQPFWNDEKMAPFTFTNFPILPKTVLYKHGIDEVEKEDEYAALLCSMHYMRFLLNRRTQEAKIFVQKEKERRNRIIRSLSTFDSYLFDFHYGLLQLCDNLSLYICLNEPGTSKEEEHFFYRDGIPLSTSLHGFQQDKLKTEWVDKDTVTINEFPFASKLTLMLKQKVISKKLIADKGLDKSYQDAPYEHVKIRLVP